MTRPERLAVLAGLLVVAVLLVVAQPVSGLLGALAGTAAGLALGERFARFRLVVDAQLGDDVPMPRSGLRVQVVVRRLLLQVVVLAALLVAAALTPLAGDRAYAVVATAATALPAVLTAQRLRR